MWRKLSCDMTPCSLVYHMVEAADPTETLINFYQSYCCHIPELKVFFSSFFPRHDNVRICLPVHLSSLTQIELLKDRPTAS